MTRLMEVALKMFIMLFTDRKLGVRTQNTAKNINKMGRMPKFLVTRLIQALLGASLTATSLISLLCTPRNSLEL
jgi:hypothetical protein